MTTSECLSLRSFSVETSLRPSESGFSMNNDTRLFARNIAGFTCMDDGVHMSAASRSGLSLAASS